METRNIKINIDQALDWLNSKNPTLKTLSIKCLYCRRVNIVCYS